MIAGIIINLIGSRASQYMFLMIRPLQLMVHLPLLTIAIPANTMVFLQYVVSVAMYDILSVFWNWTTMQSII